MGHLSLGSGLCILQGWGVACDSLITLGSTNLCLLPSPWVCPSVSLLLKAPICSSPGTPGILSAGNLQKTEEPMVESDFSFPLLKSLRGGDTEAWLPCLKWDEREHTGGNEYILISQLFYPRLSNRLLPLVLCLRNKCRCATEWRALLTWNNTSFAYWVSKSPEGYR